MTSSASDESPVFRCYEGFESPGVAVVLAAIIGCTWYGMVTLGMEQRAALVLGPALVLVVIGGWLRFRYQLALHRDGVLRWTKSWRGVAQVRRIDLRTVRAVVHISHHASIRQMGSGVAKDQNAFVEFRHADGSTTREFLDRSLVRKIVKDAKALGINVPFEEMAQTVQL